MCLRDLSRFSAVLAGLLIGSVLPGQGAPAPRRSAVLDVPRASSSAPTAVDFGSNSLTYVRLSGMDFYPYASLCGYSTAAPLRWTMSGGCGLEAALRIPSGAVIDYLELNACDTGDKDMFLYVIECDPAGVGGCISPAASVSTTGAGGCATVSASGLNYTVDNAAHVIGLEALDSTGNGDLKLASAVVGYRLQVSPAPGSATFGDVPTSHPFFRFIEALAASGVTAGCNASPPQYCPDRQITRGEMAVFLAKALGLHFPN